MVAKVELELEMVADEKSEADKSIAGSDRKVGERKVEWLLF